MDYIRQKQSNTIEKGQRGTVSFIFISLLSLWAAAFFQDSEYSYLFIILLGASLITALIWMLIYIRCPNCRKFVGEYKIGPPIWVKKNCRYCGLQLKDFD
jgi:hypothetical protein